LKKILRTITRDKAVFGSTGEALGKTVLGSTNDVVGGVSGGQSSGSHFFVMCTGQIEHGEFGSMDNLYCRYSISFGSDWCIVHGLDTGLSQIARKGAGADRSVVWNFPIDVTLKATNAFGWPRVALSVFRVDDMGRDVVVGYGSLLVPTQAGQHERFVHVYAPQASSLLQRFRSWLAGAYPEFFDSKFVAQGEGREVTRVKRTGVVKISLDVTTRGEL
ncbi:unnamed protein product, partial [Discosporangium mesarthrocarpum]